MGDGLRIGKITDLRDQVVYVVLVWPDAAGMTPSVGCVWFDFSAAFVASFAWFSVRKKVD
jgi:hypothetical protein